MATALATATPDRQPLPSQISSRRDLEQLANGQLTALTIPVLAVCALGAAIAGGALAGVKLAGKDLGNQLAAMMGAMFGPMGAVPGILVILALV